LSSLPLLLAGGDDEDPGLLQALYSTFYALHLSAKTSAVLPSREEEDSFSWKNIQGLFASLQDDKESWCVETKGNGKDPAPRHFLRPTVSPATENDRGYCSFLLQKDRSILKENLPKLPIQQLSSDWSHGDCIWFFFGRNNSSSSTASSPLEGRTEHTDSVSHGF